MGRFPKCWDRSIQMNWFKDNLTFVLISLLWFMAYDRLHYLTGGHINIHMYTLYTIHYTRTCTCVYCSLHCQRVVSHHNSSGLKTIHACMGCRLNFNIYICFKARALEFTYIENIYRKCDHLETFNLIFFTKC